MNLTVEEITKSITGKLSLYECDREELKQLVTQYPFFGPAKFLLAKKMKEENEGTADDYIQKASLYFQNPVWYDLVLNDKGVAIPLETEFAAEVREKPFTREDVIDQTQPVYKTGTAVKVEEGPGLEEEPESVESGSIEEEGLPNPPQFKFEPIDTTKAELTFEPYHTIDYFASQGIQAKEEDKPRNQFERQLKSFTEWLKVMKRLPPTEMAADVNPLEEKKVEKMAEVSINDREVVTETMAEVWEKQGNVVKATEIYRKLSLLNPSKSSYFAAKIEQLKNL